MWAAHSGSVRVLMGAMIAARRGCGFARFGPFLRGTRKYQSCPGRTTQRAIYGIVVGSRWVGGKWLKGLREGDERWRRAPDGPQYARAARDDGGSETSSRETRR